MSKQFKETSQEWITERMQAVLSAHTEEDVKATMPIILMFMVDSFGIDNLDHRIRAAVQRVLDRAGITSEMSPAEVAATMKAYVGALRVNQTILQQIKDIFDTHYAALNEEKGTGMRRFFGKTRPRPALFGAPKPAGAMSIEQIWQAPRRV